jgi:phage terminase small subunit
MKQRKFIKSYIQTGSPTKAVFLNYNVANNNSHSADNIARQNLKKPYVQKYLKDRMEEAGLTDSAISKDLKKLVDAGLTEESLRKANPGHTLRAIQEINKLKDNYPVERKQIQTTSANVNIDVKGKNPQDLAQMLDGLSNELLTFKRMINGTRVAEKLASTPTVVEEGEEV